MTVLLLLLLLLLSFTYIYTHASSLHSHRVSHLSHHLRARAPARSPPLSPSRRHATMSSASFPDATDEMPPLDSGAPAPWYPIAPSVVPASVCDRCGVTDADDSSSIMVCNRCYDRHYCSVKCQRADWTSGHRDACHEADADERTQYRESMQLRTSVRRWIHRAARDPAVSWLTPGDEAQLMRAYDAGILSAAQHACDQQPLDRPPTASEQRLYAQRSDAERRDTTLSMLASQWTMRMAVNPNAGVDYYIGLDAAGTTPMAVLHDDAVTHVVDTLSMMVEPGVDDATSCVATIESLLRCSPFSPLYARLKGLMTDIIDYVATHNADENTAAAAELDTIRLEQLSRVNVRTASRVVTQRTNRRNSVGARSNIRDTFAQNLSDSAAASAAYQPDAHFAVDRLKRVQGWYTEMAQWLSEVFTARADGGYTLITQLFSIACVIYVGYVFLVMMTEDTVSHERFSTMISMANTSITQRPEQSGLTTFLWGEKRTPHPDGIKEFLVSVLDDPVYLPYGRVNERSDVTTGMPKFFNNNTLFGGNRPYQVYWPSLYSGPASYTALFQLAVNTTAFQSYASNYDATTFATLGAYVNSPNTHTLWHRRHLLFVGVLLTTKVLYGVATRILPQNDDNASNVEAVLHAMTLNKMERDLFDDVTSGYDGLSGASRSAVYDHCVSSEDTDAPATKKLMAAYKKTRNEYLADIGSLSMPASGSVVADAIIRTWRGIRIWQEGSNISANELASIVRTVRIMNNVAFGSMAVTAVASLVMGGTQLFNQSELTNAILTARNAMLDRGYLLGLRMAPNELTSFLHKAMANKEGEMTLAPYLLLLLNPALRWILRQVPMPAAKINRKTISKVVNMVKKHAPPHVRLMWSGVMAFLVYSVFHGSSLHSTTATYVAAQFLMDIGEAIAAAKTRVKTQSERSNEHGDENA